MSQTLLMPMRTLRQEHNKYLVSITTDWGNQSKRISKGTVYNTYRLGLYSFYDIKFNSWALIPEFLETKHIWMRTRC